eukprot:CAMPEP_0183706314 /NCGR_PEP_ID=MMETSP0737-20130205/3190_1 /TAXON_ID=385413 /ORGANISM="Thalassiosira miniscula, Strain CCMP1093" /LENGTH=566 /DNA_ID=CAMNT_0025933703 /DNA_START=165 /DNA_END=1865 /DNA_ORIENTATION=-
MNSGLPQHLISTEENRVEAATMLASSVTSRGRALSRVSALALPCLLLAGAAPGGLALSISSTSTAPGASRTSLVDQARMIRELKNGSAASRRAKKRLSMDTKLSFDSDALSAALFDDDFNNSLEDAVSNMKNNKKVARSAKRRAEAFDKFMEEDAEVASIVQENIKPGSLVDDVQQHKGADIVDMEVLLQKEAADRRRSRDVKVEAKVAAPVPSLKVTRKSKLASTSSPSFSDSSAEQSSKSTLLTREQEYALAYRIQGGTRVHKIKAEYESSNSEPLTKKQWAQLADMSPNDLRKLVSDYRTAKQELVSSNMGLVRAVVRSYSRRARYRGVPMDELVQEGTLGLIRAAELFDPAKGLRFSTYATIWIKGVLSNSNSLENVIQVPHRERALWNKVRGAWEEMALEDGERATNGRGKPSVDSAKDIAAKLGMEKSKVENNLRRMSCVTNVLSLDYQYTSTTRSGTVNNKQEALMAGSQFGTDADLAEQAQFKADVVAGLVRNLSEKELTLMRLRYGLEDGTEYTIKDCASMMGINRETARLLHHKCLKKLKEASNMESLQEYLLTVA